MELSKSNACHSSQGFRRRIVAGRTDRTQSIAIPRVLMSRNWQTSIHAPRLCTKASLGYNSRAVSSAPARGHENEPLLPCGVHEPLEAQGLCTGCICCHHTSEIRICEELRTRWSPPLLDAGVSFFRLTPFDALRRMRVLDRFSFLTFWTHQHGLAPFLQYLRTGTRNFSQAF